MITYLCIALAAVLVAALPPLLATIDRRRFRAVRKHLYG